MAGSLAPGISVIISDFLIESDLGSVLAALRSARQQVVLLQVLAPQELDPDVTGDVALTDVETKASVDVTVTPGLPTPGQAPEAPVDLLVMDTFRRIGLLA